MIKFLNKDASDKTLKWKEWELQAYIIQEARRAKYVVAGDMNAGKRNPGQAKATGILAGEPDMRFYLEGPRLVLIELKTKKGIVSEGQLKHHDKLKLFGFEVYTVFGESPVDAWEKTLNCLRKNVK